MKTSLKDWLTTINNRPGGDILAVQTLRNAIMAASVLASAAMVALMGVLATAHLHPRLFAITAALGLVTSTAAALVAIVKLARAGFGFQLSTVAHDALATDVVVALGSITASAILLATALFVAAMALFV